VVVEWGEGKVEELSDTRLEVRIERALGDESPDEGDDERRVTLTGLGDRWTGTDWAVLRPAGV
jgi:tRNA threonylcarbamoyladenosine biosynthesis protein TsaE